MKLNQILETTIPGLGYEFVNAEMGPSKIITVYIDKEGGVTIEDCEVVSNHLSNLFLVEEINYNRLEVSSPGLERPLRKLTDFIRFVGSLAKIKVFESINDQKVFQGTILKVEGNTISLECDKQQIDIEYSNINRARLVFDYKLNLKRS